jgi:glyceraldehyde 3-phosphate dehydrogenase
VTAKIAINGFGRIGRNILRAICESGRSDLQVVAINDLAPPATNAHLFRYDSVHGRFNGKVQFEGDTMDLGVDLVLECTGVFTSRDKAGGHLGAGAKKVLISAPGDGVDLTVVYGVNHKALTAEHKVVSNASCTTNCLAPVAKVLNDAVGIECGHMTTIHSYTNDQNLLDVFHKDLHRARAAAMSQIPTSTGAAKAVGLVLPELKGKLDGGAIRVPTPNVSLVDLTFVPKRETSAAEINAALKAAADGELKGVLAYHEEALVSIDFNHSPASSTVDLNATKVIGGKLCRVASWYDNEWGFSNRMCDTAALMASL